jgi:phospholipase C
MFRPAAPIEDVVVLMVENAAFDRMTGCMAGSHADLDGVGPTNPRTNPDRDDRPIARAETRARNIDRDPKHQLHDGLIPLARDTNTGFVLGASQITGGGRHPAGAPRRDARRLQAIARSGRRRSV